MSEQPLFTVSHDVRTNELVARDPNGTELARQGESTTGGDATQEIAAKAMETLSEWYN